MKTKFFKTLSALAIAAVLALNVTVVLDDNATSYLNFDVIGKILADGTSGSASGTSGSGSETPYLRWESTGNSCKLPNGEEGNEGECKSGTTATGTSCSTSGKKCCTE